jgi:hypothetical protein
VLVLCDWMFLAATGPFRRHVAMPTVMDGDLNPFTRFVALIPRRGGDGDEAEAVYTSFS